MIAPEFPDNENLRQKAVEKYQLLDTLPEESYDNITALMSYICEVPISLITLLDCDRNFLKSHHGIDISESPREISFCGHAINSDDEITVIEDARLDERFADNPLVTELKATFYAGVPLVDPSGYKLGTLCVYDLRPRKLSEEQIKALKSMSKQVVNLFDQRYKNFELSKYKEQLTERNEELEKFAFTLSHDLKSPLANISALTDLLEGEIKGKLSDNARNYLLHIRSSSKQLRRYIDGILQFYKSEELLHHKSESVPVSELISDLKDMTVNDEHADLTYECNSEFIEVNRAAVMQILLNLIVNGLKYNSKDQRIVHINISSDAENTTFEVTDNGDGMPRDFIIKAYDLFAVSGLKDRKGQVGTGIGLAIVKKLTESLGGKISQKSEQGKGTTFTLFTPKFMI